MFYVPGSGWTNEMALAGIVSSAGIADSLQRASHLTRITHASKMTTSNFAKIHAQLSYNLKKYTVHDEANEKRRQEPHYYMACMEYNSYYGTLLGLILIRSYHNLFQFQL